MAIHGRGFPIKALIRKPVLDAGAAPVTLTPDVQAVTLTGQGIHLGFTILMPDEL